MRTWPRSRDPAGLLTERCRKSEARAKRSTFDAGASTAPASSSAEQGETSDDDCAAVVAGEKARGREAEDHRVQRCPLQLAIQTPCVPDCTRVGVASFNLKSSFVLQCNGFVRIKARSNAAMRQAMESRFRVQTLRVSASKCRLLSTLRTILS